MISFSSFSDEMQKIAADGKAEAAKKSVKPPAKTPSVHPSKPKIELKHWSKAFKRGRHIW